MKRKYKAIEEVSKYDVVIISGASSGIGEGFAKFVLDVFERQNKKSVVYNLSRRQSTLVSSNLRNIECDLTIEESLNSAVKQIKYDIAQQYADVPKILLINNAGFGAYGEFPSPTIERNLKMIDLNVRALTALSEAFLEEVKKGKGAIVNISSTASFQACPHLSVYAATKAYVKSFTIALSQELSKCDCKCLCVCPGPTSSMFFKSAGFDSAPLPSGFGHKPIDVVLQTFYTLYRNKKITIVGKLNTLQAILVSIIPEFMLVRISDMVLKKIRSK